MARRRLCQLPHCRQNLPTISSQRVQLSSCFEEINDNKKKQSDEITDIINYSTYRSGDITKGLAF